MSRSNDLNVCDMQDMKMTFSEEPKSQTIDVGQMVVLQCAPPEGVPLPEVILYLQKFFTQLIYYY